ncbi:hypothetical protein K1719_036577 [Acacia pycnantha]|nr:hypothetical protein K1719_036577 [Acacia pycnantha]
MLCHALLRKNLGRNKQLGKSQSGSLDAQEGVSESVNSKAKGSRCWRRHKYKFFYLASMPFFSLGVQICNSGLMFAFHTCFRNLDWGRRSRGLVLLDHVFLQRSLIPMRSDDEDEMPLTPIF